MLALRKGSETVKMQLIDCWGPVCSVMRFFQPAAFLPIYYLPLDNASLQPFQMTAAVNATGDATRASLVNVLTVKSPVSVPPQLVYNLPIEVGCRKPLPDHYVGDVQLKTAAGSPPLKVPVDINVRTGPGLAFFVLIVGIALGRLVKYMKDKGTPQSDLLVRFYRLEKLARSSGGAYAILRSSLDEAKESIYNEPLDKATKNMTDAENRWTLLKTLLDLQSTLEPRKGEAEVKGILEEIGRAKDLIRDKFDAEATTSVQTIRKEVAALKEAQPRMYAMALQQADRAQGHADRTVQSTPGRRKWYVRFLTGLSGIDGGAQAELTLWVVRPLIYVLTILLLAFFGMQQFYMKNPIFGVDPTSDYFGLLAWGMSSDIATRTLASLKG